MQILDGRTGKVRQSTLDAAMPAGDAHRPYEMENGDSIAFLNLSAIRTARILVKDRYTHFWIYNNKLELLWRATGDRSLSLSHRSDTAGAIL